MMAVAGARPLYGARASRALDARAIEAHGMAGAMLMERAGAAAFTALLATWPRARHIAVVCGTGNNGGDGFVIARLARERGLAARVHVVGEETRIRGEAAQALAALRQAGGTIEAGLDGLDRADVIVDALLGTGLDRAPAAAQAAAIAAINGAGRPVLCVDLPSGLAADTGHAPGAAVRGALTVTFIGRKLGLVTGLGPALTGRLLFDDLGVPAAVYDAVPAAAHWVGYGEVARAFPARPRDAHKGRFGHVLVVGGGPGMAGAVRLCALAAARVGAGLVSVATHPGHAAALDTACAEVMCRGVADGRELRALAARATVLALGPGLGQEPWGRALAAAARALGLPAVLDADALNLLALEPDRAAASRILTPHPGEASRLLDCTTGDVAADRYAAARALVARYGGVALLKGAGTVVQGSGLPVVIEGGNPGMASGGMGDVLTGVIAGLLAQGCAADEAAVAGAALHAWAADRAAEEGGERGLLAGDLLPWLRRGVNPKPD